MNLQKNFPKLPIYVVAVYFFASISITIYLAQHASQSKQYAQTLTTPALTPQAGVPSQNCLVAGGCNTSTPTPTPTTTPALNSITDPCVSTSASMQNYTVQNNQSNNKDGFFKQFLKFIIELIKQLLQMLGLQPIKTPIKTAPIPPTNPSTTIMPTTGIPTIGVSNNPIPNPCPTTSTPATTPTGSTPTSTTPPDTTPPSSGKNVNVKITFYTGYETGGLPEGNYVAEPVKHQRAGGTGNYTDPLTFAAMQGGDYPRGTIIYVPLVQKYFIREDLCPGCSANHVDLYIGNPSNAKVAADCAGALTPPNNIAIIVNPPESLTYDSTPIWNQSTGTCMAPHN